MGAIVSAQFGEDVPNAPFNGFFAERELSSDLLVGIPIGNQTQDGELAWSQGVVSYDEAIDMDYPDALQMPFYRFSREGYAIAKETAESELTETTFASVKLDWTIERPLPEEVRQRCQLKPPSHEWPKRP